MVLSLSLFVSCPPGSVSHPDKMGWKWWLIRAHLLVGPGRWRSTADTIGMYRGCLWWQRPVESCYSLRWVLHSPRGIGPGSLVPRQCQAAQSPRKSRAVTYVCSHLGGSCDLLGQDSSSVWSPASGTHAGFGGSWPASMPISGVANHSHSLCLWHSGRWCPDICKFIESSWQWYLAFLAVPGFPLNSLSCVILAPSAYLQDSHPSPLPGSNFQSLSLSTQPAFATVGMQTSVSGWEALVGTDFCGEFSLFCLLCTCCCVPLWVLEFLASPPVGGFWAQKHFLLHSSLP